VLGKSMARGLPRGSRIGLVTGVAAAALLVLMPDVATAMNWDHRGRPNSSGNGGIRPIGRRVPAQHNAERPAVERRDSSDDEDLGTGPSGSGTVLTAHGRPVWSSATRQSLLQDHNFHEADSVQEIRQELARQYGQRRASSANILGVRRIPGQPTETATWFMEASPENLVRVSADGHREFPTSIHDIVNQGWDGFVYSINP